MRKLYRYSVSNSKQQMFVICVCCAVIILMFSSCANLPVQHEGQQAELAPLPIRYSIVCIIHGDGNYIFHDTEGNEYRADDEALAKAQRVASQNPQAETFIFHQRPERNFLSFFPRHDGEFFYYRNGQLVANEVYWRDDRKSRFTSELELFRRFSTDTQSEKKSMFLFYYGHEIPEVSESGYDASHSDRTITLHDFANGLQCFISQSMRFDLLVLSTCYGGTPNTVETFGSFARYIVASPENLHLSYFDFHSLERLDLKMQGGDVHAFAKKFARQSFEKLAVDVETAVSVGVYDVDRMQEYLHSVHNIYGHTLASIDSGSNLSKSKIEHCDCAELPAYVLPTMNNGVEIYYRPARFGRSQNKTKHSGWECWRDKASQDYKSVLK